MRTGSGTPVDAIDRAMMAHLERDGRATLPELAAAVSLSSSACQRRLRRLEREGAIRGYRAVLDPEVSGRSLVVFVAVQLVDHTRATTSAFDRAVVGLQGLVSAHHVTGESDYLLRVDVAGIEDLDALGRQHMATLPGVARFTTMVATSDVRDQPDLVPPPPRTSLRP